MTKIIVVDVGGTLVKPEMIEEANKFRAAILKTALPSKELHAKPEELYKLNREAVAELTGLKSGIELKYRTNDGKDITIPSEKYHNQIATDLFRIGMYMTAKENKQNIFYPGVPEALKQLQAKGFKLALCSGIRTDIISGVLNIAECPVQFDYILGQPPILGRTNEEMLQELSKLGEVVYVIGDKKADLEPAKALKAKAVWVKWGHPKGGEQEIADITCDSAEDLKKLA